MKPYVYLIFDLIKNKPYYVGKHNGSNKKYITGSKILWRYIKLFGIDAFLSRFDKQILEYTTIENLNNIEEKYIRDLNTKINGGNLTWGGRWDIHYRTPTKKPILQYDLNGLFIKEWDFVRQPIDNGIGTDYNGISACCLGKQRTANGYIWRFKEKVNIPTNISPGFRKQYKQRYHSSQTKPLFIFNIYFPSITSAHNILEISPGKLRKLMKLNQIDYKFI